jgi:hypothetical protein
MLSRFLRFAAPEKLAPLTCRLLAGAPDADGEGHDLSRLSVAAYP